MTDGIPSGGLCLHYRPKLHPYWGMALYKPCLSREEFE